MKKNARDHSTARTAVIMLVESDKFMAVINLGNGSSECSVEESCRTMQLGQLP